MLTDKDSYKTQTFIYMPYGETWVKEGAEGTVDRMFAGQIYDQESGYLDPGDSMPFT